MKGTAAGAEWSGRGVQVQGRNAPGGSDRLTQAWRSTRLITPTVRVRATTFSKTVVTINMLICTKRLSVAFTIAYELTPCLIF